jgi:putative ABC transport system ATP-binding protein
VLSAHDLQLRYGSTVALAGAGVTVPEACVVALVGPSGSGKSSLLYCLAGLVRPDAGTVLLGADDLTRCPDDTLSDLRRREFGFVFQSAQLVPELTLRQNVGLPLELNGVSRNRRERRVAELLAALGIAEQADRRPSQVSGGQAQRAAVARAMVHRPRVLFADEPTGALDSANGEVVLQALMRLARENGTSVVLVTHDERLAAQADRVVALRDGRTVGDR